MKLFTIIAALLIGIVGCAKDAETTSNTTNSAVDVETLFKYEGCTVYRFVDAGRYHYYTKCANKVETMGTYSTNCGKGCVATYDENIRTE